MQILTLFYVVRLRRLSELLHLFGQNGFDCTRRASENVLAGGIVKSRLRCKASVGEVGWTLTETMMASSPGLDVAADPKRSHFISVKLRDTNQLFNSMDPSPFIEKDLDDKAEEFIVGWAREFPPGARLKLRVLHNHFAHRAQPNTLELRAMLKQERTSLLFGLSCLAACLVIIKTLLSGEPGTWAACCARVSPSRAGSLCGAGTYTLMVHATSHSFPEFNCDPAFGAVSALYGIHYPHFRCK